MVGPRRLESLRSGAQVLHCNRGRAVYLVANVGCTAHISSWRKHGHSVVLRCLQLLARVVRLCQGRCRPALPLLSGRLEYDDLGDKHEEEGDEAQPVLIHAIGGDLDGFLESGAHVDACGHVDAENGPCRGHFLRQAILTGYLCRCHVKDVELDGAVEHALEEHDPPVIVQRQVLVNQGGKEKPQVYRSTDGNK